MNSWNCAILAVLLPQLAVAENLTWTASVAETRLSNPDLKSARSALESSRANLRIVESGYVPEVAGTAEVNRFGGEAPSTTASHFGVTADIPIFSGWSTRSAQLAQRKIVAQREADLLSAETRIRSDLRRAFADVLFAQQSLELDRAISERLDRNARFVRLRYEGGIEARWASAKALADAEDARWQIHQSERALGSNRQRLASILGRNEGRTLLAEGELLAPEPLSDITSLEQSIPEQHPDIRSLRAASESFFESIRGAQSGHWPTLTGNADYQWAGVNEWPATDLWSVGAGLRFPFYSGGQTLAQVDQAQADYQQAVASLQAKKLQVKSDLISAQAAYLSAVLHVPVTAATLAAADERARTIVAQYSAGLKGYLDWEQSQTLLTESQRSDVQARYQTLLTLAEWERAIGKDLSQP